MTEEPDFARLIKNRQQARLIDFGLGEYGKILQDQFFFHQSRLEDNIPDTWLLGEHPLVITQGVRSHAEEFHFHNDLLKEAPIHQIDRGGMTTLHSPGQLIIYPIVKLTEGSLGAGRFARALLAAMREWIKEEYGIEAQIEPHRPGLYVDGHKLLSIGISARHGVTMHGVALNVSNDLSLWNGLIACGEPGTRPISVDEILGSTTSASTSASSIKNWLRNAWTYDEILKSAIE